MGIKTHLTVGVNRLLARVSFGSTPVKLQHLIPELKVAMDRKVEKFGSRRYAPNHFIIYLSLTDLATHAPLLDAFRHAVVEELEQRAADKGWSLLSDKITIDLQPWDELPSGEFQIDPRIVEAKHADQLPMPAPPKPEPVPAADDTQPPPPPVDGVTAPMVAPKTHVASPKTRQLIELEERPTEVATAVFKIVRGKAPGDTRVMVGREAVLGRGADADLLVDDDSASRRHARLRLQDGRLGIEDLGSSAGTLLNGAKVDKGWLKPGAKIQLGDTVLELIYLPGAPA
jgi:hypothetical protein